MEKTLMKLGLTKNEAKIYLALTKLGTSSTGKIAKQANLHRRTVYDVVDRLINKGLVSFSFQKDKKYFHPCNPEKLFEILKDKEEELKDILPKLKKRYQQTEEESKAEVYKGVKGIKTVMGKILNEKEWLAIGSTGRGKKVLSTLYVKKFMKKIEAKKIKYKLLITRNKVAEKEAKERKQEAPKTEYKFLPHYIKNPVLIWIFGGNVAFLPNQYITKQSDRKLFLIKDKENANALKDYFKWLWRVAKK